MDTNTGKTESEKLNGLFVRAVVMSSTAKALKRKDGTFHSLIVNHRCHQVRKIFAWEQATDYWIAGSQ